MGEPGPHTSGFERDDALCRLEDVLLSLPEDRAVPELDLLLEAAGVGREILDDERARKLLTEALVGRPFGSFEVVRQVRTEVELLTAEVDVLTERLADPDLHASARAEDAARIAVIRRRLRAIREQL